ncbi:papain-like cysteine protease family protein [Pedobacter frigoris]|uniref:papain-like cysteine protease family protein n=1 Tax=Pedobacter frigoris TaxID=2571272 RepID=UPI00292D53EA|nr:papain-like cysteine protease family protein [Pedobacter frigoris]
MLTLKKTISYGGDISLSPVKEIELKFKSPIFSYQKSPDKNHGKPVRTVLSIVPQLLGHALEANNYQAELPLSNLIGKDVDQIGNFLTYSLEAYKKGYLNEVSFGIDVDFMLNPLVIGDTRLEAVYLIKYIERFYKQYFNGSQSETIAVNYLDKNLFLINRKVYNEVLPDFYNIDGSGEEYKLLYALQKLVEVADLDPQKPIDSSILTNEVLTMLFKELNTKATHETEEFLKRHLERLFDFDMHVPEIKAIDIKGVFAVNAPDEVTITKDHLVFYDLSVEYSRKNSAQTSDFNTLHFDWNQNPNVLLDNKVDFSFTALSPIIVNGIDSPVRITVKGLNGVVLWSNDFDAADPVLQGLYIEVPLQVPNTLSVTEETEVKNDNRKLRGQVLELSKKCPLKDLTVIVQAKKENDTVWRIVGAAKTDNSGSFSMPYPFGIYTEAEAIVSMAPNSAVAIAIVADHTNNRTISDDFLYLLVEGEHCGEEGHEDDCDCHSPKKASRLPDQEDLINSDEYTQDIGGSCINLSTPNRTLSEYSYKALVRVSDPDVANYTLRKLNNQSSQQVGNESIAMHAFEISGGAEKIKRSPVDLSNPVKWQDAPDDRQSLSFYQSVTVATGHILHYKSVFKADGYSLGDLLYSLPLAPGQKKQIVVFDSSHSLQAAESQSLSQGERLAAEILNEREILNQLGGNIGEALSGESTASTAGINASLGVAAIAGPVGGVLGVSGGYSTSSSSASQNSSRDVSQFFGEKLRQAITQNADSYRQQNASVVTSIGEGQRYAATTEVVANHNHCHALTMLYFEVLRHFAIYQELAAVEECVFVPLLMTDFSKENVYKWQDVLARHLLPISANTYLRANTFMVASRQHPLLKAFDANERIKTNYAHVDFPNGRYDEEKINFIKGEMYIRTNLPRPKTRYDRIKSLPVVTKTVTHEEFDLQTANKSVVLAAATGGMSLLFGSPSATKTVSEQVIVIGAIFDSFMTLDANYQSVPPANCIRVKNFQPTSFTLNLPGIPAITIPISGADFFENDIVDKQRWETYALILGYVNVFDMLNHYFAGRLIAEWDDIFNHDIAPVIFEKIVDSISVQGIQSDFTSSSKYYGAEQLIRLNLSGTTSNRRMDFPATLELKSNSDTIKLLKQSVTLNIENTRILYSTSHYNGTLYSGNPGDDLLDGTTLYIPITPDEQRNPRKEDVYLVNKLIEHLNSNLEYYNKVLWYKLDPDRRFMLLDGFNIQVYNDFGVPTESRSLASVVKNELITVVGNSLVFPVAAGYKVNQSYIQETTEKGEVVRVSLFEHYKPLTPVPPYRVSIPSKGVFLEAVQGSCDACEKVKENTSQDWTKFTTDEPTPINPLTPPIPVVTDWKANYKDFATPIINIQNAPAAPAPGAGLEGLSELLGKAGIFKDITGLDANQQNALKTYLSNQENAKAFAEMAKGLSTQGHNTANTDKIMDSIQTAKDSGAINDEEYGKLVKEHLQQQIDGGESKKAEQEKEKASKPTLTDAAVKAADQGKNVKAQKTDADGTVESVDIKGNGSETVLAKVSGTVPKLKQEKAMACWATVATMMVNWKRGQDKILTVEEVLTEAGNDYLEKYNNDEGLKSSEKDGFITALDMVGEAPASYSLQQYVDWINTYGPLWITTDSSDEDADFSPHARILTRITGTGTADGSGTSFIFNDPATGTEMTESFVDFIKAFEQMASDNSDELYIQVVHFTDKKTGGSAEGGGSAVIRDQFLTDVVNDPANQFRNSEDINAFFESKTGFDFVVFFNKFIGNKGSWGGINIATEELFAIRFINIWDNVVSTLGLQSINLIQFLCLQSAINNETGGKLDIPSEGVGIKDFRGLKYTYSDIPKGYIPNYPSKVSYNQSSNKLAFNLFKDAAFLGAHGSLSGADTFKNTTDARWKGKVYPLTETDPNKLPFVAQADFHKYRGRGYIQLTWRGNYLPVIDFILKYTGTNPVMLQHQTAWLAQSSKPIAQMSTNEYKDFKDKIATITSNHDWDELFQNTDSIVALKVLDLHGSGNVLKNIKTDTAQRCKNSILAYGTSLNGAGYNVKLYNRVMQMLNKLGN